MGGVGRIEVQLEADRSGVLEALLELAESAVREQVGEVDLLGVLTRQIDRRYVGDRGEVRG